MHRGLGTRGYHVNRAAILSKLFQRYFLVMGHVHLTKSLFELRGGTIQSLELPRELKDVGEAFQQLVVGSAHSLENLVLRQGTIGIYVQVVKELVPSVIIPRYDFARARLPVNKLSPRGTFRTDLHPATVLAVNSVPGRMWNAVLKSEVLPNPVVYPIKRKPGHPLKPL